MRADAAPGVMIHKASQWAPAAARVRARVGTIARSRITAAAARMLAGVLVFVASFVYRFSTMGGAFGGFENDQFLVVSRARQILVGDLPARDFADPGAPLTYMLSAAAQAALGSTLLSEAVLTIAMLSAGAAVTFALATRISASVTVGLIAAMFQVLLEPRFYNYPKILVYAVALLLWWRYARKPDLYACAYLAAWTAIAFLFRHDHAVYLTLVTMALVAVRRGVVEPAHAIREGLAYLCATAILVGPYLAFLQRHVGLRNYLDSGIVFSQQDAARTQLRSPGFVFARPSPVEPRAERRARINVRWRAGMLPAERADKERAFGLAGAQVVGPEVWNYAIRDGSTENLQRLVTDPEVLDTHGVDRHAYRLIRHAPEPPPPSPSLPWWVGENALAWLYYFVLAVPGAAIFLLILARDRVLVAAPAERALPGVGCVLALAVLLDAAFLRGSLSSRIADVGVPIAVSMSWLLSMLVVRRVVGRTRLVKAAVAGLAAGLLATTFVAVLVFGRVGHQIEVMGLGYGLRAFGQRTAAVYAFLNESPSYQSRTLAGSTPSMKLAEYIRHCTRADDRVFVMSYLPEVFFFAERGFAGGHLTVQPGFFKSAREQRLTISRLARQSVPLVITESKRSYDEDYAPDFPLLDRYVADRYREAGVADLGDALTVRVLVKRDSVVTATYEPLSLPCPSPAGSSP